MGKRIASIDCLRAVAVFFVVLAHVRPFAGYGADGNYLYVVLDTIGQFDVPFFFVTAGYFFAPKLEPGKVGSYVKHSFRKLGSLYGFGILTYLSAVVFSIGVAALSGRQLAAPLVNRLVEGLSPLGVLYYGDAVAPPFWFLTALFFSICAISLFVVAEKVRYLLPVAAGVHFVGLVVQNYPALVSVSFPTRDALFFGFFYTALGFQLRTIDWSPSRDRSRLYLGAFGLAVVTQLLEQYFVNFLSRGVTIPEATYTTEYTVATVFLVLSLFGYALSNPDWGRGTVLEKLGPYAVGVYLVHFPVFRALVVLRRLLQVETGIDLSATLAWQLLVTPVVYALALAVYVLAARIGLVEIGGSHLPRLSRIRDRVRRSGVSIPRL